MLARNSRYSQTQPFAPRRDGSTVFRGLGPRRISQTPGVIEHVLRDGDRLDLLARHYYNDDRLWWRILDANPQLLFGGDLMPLALVGQEVDSDCPVPRKWIGQKIRIPRAQEA